MKPLQLIILMVLLTSAACSKKDDNNNVAGKGGNATLNIFPQHHTLAKNIINCKVYVKYNTLDAPSDGKYDDSTSCINTDSLVKATLSQLKNGKYYLYAYGFDTSISQNIKGGLGYTITQQATQTVLLPVSED
jgi:hypothetical protein